MNLAKFQRYKELWIAGVILVVLALVIAFFLLKNRSSFRDAKAKMQSAQTQLETLHRGKPYPSRDNVKIAAVNLEELTTFRAEILDRLSDGQIEPLDVEPAAFPLGPALYRLKQAAEHNDVIVSTEAYGFEKYVATGVPPSATNDMERLTVQLQTIEHLCKLLFENGISELTSVEREVFEETVQKVAVEDAVQPRRGGRRDRRNLMKPMKAETVETSSESDLYSVETVEVTFRSDPSVVWRVLNALAADHAACVVKGFELEGAGTEHATSRPVAPRARPSREPLLDPRASASRDLLLDHRARPPRETLMDRDPAGLRADERLRSGVSAGPDLQDIVPHDERIVAGKDKVLVTLTIEVYRFNRPDELTESGGDSETEPVEETN